MSTFLNSYAASLAGKKINKQEQDHPKIEYWRWLVIYTLG